MIKSKKKNDSFLLKRKICDKDEKNAFTLTKLRNFTRTKNSRQSKTNI